MCVFALLDETIESQYVLLSADTLVWLQYSVIAHFSPYETYGT